MRDGAALPRGAWRGVIESTLALAFPRACVACGGAMHGAEAGVVCGACWSRVPLLPKPWCARCGHPISPAGAGGACPVCALLHPRVSALRSVCWVPHAQSSPLLAALKYTGWWGIADAMAERMVRTGRELTSGAPTPLLVPVPLAAGRRRERGYNQSEHLARSLARRLGGEVLADVLVRVRATVSQTQLTPAERSANMLNAFVAPTPRHAAIRGLTLILVDDVFTTGATLNACATALLEGGASDIKYWTFGRARSDADRSGSLKE